MTEKRATTMKKKQVASKKTGGRKNNSTKDIEKNKVAKTKNTEKIKSIVKDIQESQAKISPHKSFKRTYREDYLRQTNVPSVGYHIFFTFKMLFSKWKLFLPLMVIVVVVVLSLMGLIEGAFYQDAGAGVVFSSAFLVLFLTTIFILRHTLAGNKITLRDALYNAMTPMLSTLVVALVALIQTVPIMLLIIAYSAAIETHFLDTPFYALLFLVVAALLVLLSAYLLSSTLIALVAVSAPGLYPLEALRTAGELMMGRRVKFILRLFALVVVVGLIWGIMVWPFAKWLPGTPILSVMIAIAGCFSVIYLAAYIYLYYRWMLKDDTSEADSTKEHK